MQPEKLHFCTFGIYFQNKEIKGKNMKEGRKKEGMEEEG